MIPWRSENQPLLNRSQTETWSVKQNTSILFKILYIIFLSPLPFNIVMFFEAFRSNRGHLYRDIRRRRWCVRNGCYIIVITIKERLIEESLIQWFINQWLPWTELRLKRIAFCFIVSSFSSFQSFATLCLSSVWSPFRVRIRIVSTHVLVITQIYHIRNKRRLNFFIIQLSPWVIS